MKNTTIVIAALLAGCAAATPQEARELEGRTVHITVADDYQSVYRRIVDVERRCFQTNLITASQIVNSDLYTDTRTASISVGIYGMSAAIYQVIDIAAEADATHITASFPLGDLEQWRDRISGWADGTRTAC